MDDLRYVEIERKSVFGAHCNRRELRVVIMRFSAAGPIEYDIRCRHQFDLHHPGVDGVLAGIKRRDPHALMARVDQVAVLELKAAHVLMGHADVGNDHANVANRNLHHGYLLHLHEPRVQIPSARKQDLLLQPAPAPAVEECCIAERCMQVAVGFIPRDANRH